MPWREASPMDQRTQFIADHLRDVLSITELCALYGVSRKTGYKWIDRYVRHGPAGLEEASRRPRRSPNQTPERCREEGEPDAPAHRLPREPLFRARARRHGSVEGAREAGECRPSRPLRRARAAREHACHDFAVARTPWRAVQMAAWAALR